MEIALEILGQIDLVEILEVILSLKNEKIEIYC